MKGHKRWQNSQDVCRTSFVTTTCLGFARVLQRREVRERLLQILISDCRHYGAVLHAYCIMDHHIHLLVRSPETETISWFMQQFKRHSASEILPLLTPTERRRLLPHQGLDNRQFWKPRFRGEAIQDERMFWGCGRYIHLNPVRALICKRTIDYEWSSAKLYEECLWNEETGIMNSVDAAE